VQWPAIRSRHRPRASPGLGSSVAMGHGADVVVGGHSGARHGTVIDRGRSGRSGGRRYDECRGGRSRWTSCAGGSNDVRHCRTHRPARDSVDRRRGRCFRSARRSSSSRHHAALANADRHTQAGSPRVADVDRHTNADCCSHAHRGPATTCCGAGPLDGSCTGTRRRTALHAHCVCASDHASRAARPTTRSADAGEARSAATATSTRDPDTEAGSRASAGAGRPPADTAAGEARAQEDSEAAAMAAADHPATAQRSDPACPRQRQQRQGKGQGQRLNVHGRHGRHFEMSLCVALWLQMGRVTE
jgi:hypothetical protein